MVEVSVIDTDTEPLIGSLTSQMQNIITVLVKKFPRRLDLYKNYHLKIRLEHQKVLTVLNARIKREVGGLYQKIYEYEFESAEVIIGYVQFQSDQPVSAFGFNCEYLSQWLHKAGSQISNNAEDTTLIRIPKINPHELFTAAEFSIWLKYDPEIISNRYPESGAMVKDKWFIEIKSTTYNLIQFRELSRKIIRLIAFATQSPIMFRETFVLQGGNRFEGHFFSMYEVEPDEDFLGLQALFLYSEVEPIISTVIGQWLELYNICGGAIDNYIGISHNKSLYWENSFLMQIQSLEGFHRAILNTKKYPADKFKEIRTAILTACPQEHKDWLNSLISNEPSLGMRIREIWEKYQINTRPWYQKEFSNLDSKSIKKYRDLLTHSELERPKIKEVSPYIRLLNKVNQEIILRFLGAKRRYDDA